jgi:Fe-S oxidoreductase
MYGPEVMEAFHAFKRAWDPSGRMNPGKKIDPYPLDTNIRYGPARHLRPVETYFSFPQDGGAFANAAERCFGVGKCRALGGATMCPSFQVTREEKHSTRGRAHLLYEMLAGEEIAKGWRDESVKEALDLCLSCKGCKGECPVNVDMATYKAEFLAHYYEGRLRPRHAYALGLVSRWSRLAEIAPGLANAFTRLPGLSRGVKALAGIAPQRPLPGFAAETFRAAFARRDGPDRSGAPRVVLWPDTFNDHFFPATAHHAVEVLENAGYAVDIPQRRVCCGRPLYDYGMLRRARAMLEHDLDVLAPALDAGLPVVFLEPSCAAVFRDELPNLLPHDERARRLARQTVLFAELLEQTPGWTPPRLDREAVLHGHCHQKAVLGGTGAEQRLLERMGVRVRTPESGCCGMAGSFGYEKDHYAISMKIGERVLLPEVRRAHLDQLLVADGFSCREQIAQGTARQALHLADVLAMALHEGPGGPGVPFPESRYVDTPAPPSVRALVALGLALCALGVAVRRSQRWRRSM